MRHGIGFVLPLVVLSAVVAVGARASDRVHYREWVNYRFQYQFDLPTDMVPGQEPEDGDGRGFLSPDRKLHVGVCGENNAMFYTVAQDYAVEIKDYYKGARITYKRLAKTWYVISGIENGRIFYEKTIYHDGQLDTVAIDYPSTDASRFNPIAAHIARTFRYVPHEWVEDGYHLAGTAPLSKQ